jgi:hypothetical protein
MSSIVLSSDTLKSPPSIGEIEYNGKILTATPQANTQRGIVPTEQFFRLDSNLTGANATGAQNIFGVGVTLAGSTVYEFEIMFVLSKTAGTTSHSVSLLFGGTATLNNIAVETVTNNFSSLTGTNSANTGWLQFIKVATATAITQSITTAGWNVHGILKGTVSVNAGGTFIPQYSLNAAPGGAYTTQIGSYMKIKPIGASGDNTSVGTWA